MTEDYRLMIAVLGAVLVALAIGVRWIEPRFAFFPTRGETTTPADFGVAFDPTTVATADGERLRVWRLHAPRPRALVVYFHGNGGNLSVWAPILSSIAQHGYDVIAFDYRGYGLSTGRPTERGLYRDVDAVLAHVSGETMRPLVFWGRSLGTATAAYAASRRAPDRIVLEAGFPDARSLVRSSPLLALLSRFSTYRFATARWMRGVRTPALVMHGTRDSVIPFTLGRALFDRIDGPKTFVALAGADHDDATPPDERAYWTAIDRFVANAHGARHGAKQ